MARTRKKRSLVKIVFPRSVLGPLTYACPPDVDATDLVGRRVVAALRKRKAVGVVLSKVARAPRGREPSEVLEVLDPSPVVPPDLLTLSSWLEERYCCSAPQSLKTVTPSVPAVVRDTVVVLRTACPMEVALLLEEEHPLEAAILRHLSQKGQASRRSLPEGSDRADLERALKRLAREGHLAAEAVERVHIPHARTPQWVSLERAGGTADRVMRVVRFLRDRGGTCSAEALKEELGTGAAEIRRLSAAGVISVHRPPHSDATPLPQLTAELAGLRAAVLSGTTDQPLVLRRTPGLELLPLWGHLARATLEAGESVVVLYPEVARARAAADQLERWFPGKVAALYGTLSPGRKEKAWASLISGETPLLVGTRTAAFGPLARVGLAVMNDEDDRAYKSEETPRYHAREVLLQRSRSWESRVVLSSLCPSLESFAETEQGDWHFAETNTDPDPPAELVDLTDPAERGARWHISATLASCLADCLRRDTCAVVVHNRRGFSPFLLCRDCGYTPQCPRCEIPLVYHRREGRLDCHHCGFSLPVPDTCDRCNGIGLVPRGTGGERVEEEVARVVPGASVAFLEARRPMPDVAHTHVVVATQALLRQQPWEGISVVALLEAELGLGFPDFRASERTFQLITALRDWAARCPDSPRVIVQSRCPETPCIALACGGKYRDYAASELELRSAVGYPPFRSLVRVEVSSPDEAEARRVARRAASGLRRTAEVLGPSAAPLPKLRDRHRYQLLVKGDPGEELARETCKRLRRLRLPRGVRLVVDPDPVSMT
jgi:primosomal protein N' (replication factor Y)